MDRFKVSVLFFLPALIYDTHFFFDIDKNDTLTKIITQLLQLVEEGII